MDISDEIAAARGARDEIDRVRHGPADGARGRGPGGGRAPGAAAPRPDRGRRSPRDGAIIRRHHLGRDPAPEATAPTTRRRRAARPARSASPASTQRQCQRQRHASLPARPGQPEPTKSEYRHVAMALDLAGLRREGQAGHRPARHARGPARQPVPRRPPQGSAGVAVGSATRLMVRRSLRRGRELETTHRHVGRRLRRSRSPAGCASSGAWPTGPSSVGDPVLPGIADLDLVELVGDTEELEPVKGATILDAAPAHLGGRLVRRPDDHTAVAEVEAADGKRLLRARAQLRRQAGAVHRRPRRRRAGRPSTTSSRWHAKRYAEGGGGLL